MNQKRFWIAALVFTSAFISAAAIGAGLWQFFIAGRIAGMLSAGAGALLLVYIWLVLSGKLK
jgi:hypothetical protein